MDKNVSLFEKVTSFRVKQKEEEVWCKWVNQKERTCLDLVDLLHTDIRDVYKKKALFLLLMPRLTMSPVYWKGHTGTFCYRPDFFGQLNEELLTYSANLVIDCINAMLNNIVAKQENSKKTWGEKHLLYESLQFYNECIRNMLLYVSEEQGMRLMNHYTLCIPQQALNMFDEETLSCAPFCQLLRNTQVAEAWKEHADHSMRKLITLDGGSINVDLLQNYANALSDILKDQEFPYSDELLCEQVLFLMDFRIMRTKLIAHNDAATIFCILREPRHRGVRYIVAGYVLLEDNDTPFVAHNEETKRFANMVFLEFPGDKKLIDMLEATCDRRDIFRMFQTCKQGTCVTVVSDEDEVILACMQQL